MSGQIIRRGEGTWLVRVPLGRSADGTRRYHNHTVKGTKRDAERYRTKTLRALDTGTFADETHATVAEFLSEWLETSAKPRVRSRTLADYRALADRYLVPALGHRKLAQLAPADIQRAYNDLSARGLSARTVRYAHSVLHGALEQAVRWNLLVRNVGKLVDLPREERREMRALTSAEASQLLAAARGTRFEALWILLLTSGIRPGEALGLKWSDIDADRVRIQRTLVRQRDGSWELAEPKTPRARRVVTLPLTTQRALQSHRARQLEERFCAGPNWEGLDLVFASGTGGPLEWRLIARRYFRPLLRAAGLGSLRPYDLRHSCATLLLAAGENVKVVSERLGHASVALTLDVYSHVLPDMQQRAAERMESLLFGS